jgi:hypothetical protein
MFLGEEKGKRVNVARGRANGDGGADHRGAGPFCQTMFRDALGAVSAGSQSASPKLLDIVQLVAVGLPAERE